MILDKINRFRQDIQMSSICKIVPRLGNITKIASRGPCLFVELCPRMRPWISSQPTAWVEGLWGSVSFIKNLIHDVVGRNVLLCLCLRWYIGLLFVERTLITNSEC